MQYDTTLSTEQCRRMLAAVEPEWTLRQAEHVDAGHHTVYLLTVRTPAGTESVYLKATPPGKPPTVSLEARLLAGIGGQSPIPVPTVLGVVDEHDECPAPYVLLSAVSGRNYSRKDLPSVSDGDLRRLARRSGRYLTDLHALDAVDGYGFLTHVGPRRTGERPADDFSTVAVIDPTDDWRTCLRNWADGTLSRLAETRFADVVSEAEPVLAARIDSLQGPFEPVLGRVDHSIENVLVDDTEIRAFLDWEFTLAATPAYDLTCVAWSLAGGPYQFSHEDVERRPLVRDALLDGYLDRHSGGTVDQYHANRPCYELLSTLRSMVHLEDWYGLFDLGHRVDDAAAQLRMELDDRL